MGFRGEGVWGEVSGGLYPPEAEPLLINEHGILKFMASAVSI